jgi:hypothetical protein
MASSKKIAVRDAEESGDTSTALAVLNEDVPTSTTDSPRVTVSNLIDELSRLDNLDRERLGTLLRRGQRLAAHVQAKVSLPEFTSWTQDVQHFMNEFGL